MLYRCDTVRGKLRECQVIPWEAGLTSSPPAQWSNRRVPAPRQLSQGVSRPADLELCRHFGYSQCLCIRSRNFPLVTMSPGTPSTTVSIFVSGMMVPSILTTCCENGWYTAPFDEYPATNDAPRNKIRIFLVIDISSVMIDECQLATYRAAKSAWEQRREDDEKQLARQK